MAQEMNRLGSHTTMPGNTEPSQQDIVPSKRSILKIPRIGAEPMLVQRDHSVFRIPHRPVAKGRFVYPYGMQRCPGIALDEGADNLADHRHEARMSAGEVVVDHFNLQVPILMPLH